MKQPAIGLSRPVLVSSSWSNTGLTMSGKYCPTKEAAPGREYTTTLLKCVLFYRSDNNVASLKALEALV